jgi:hypothetical protein
MFKDRLVYFGALPAPNQTVSQEVQELGLELLRISPSQVKFTAIPRQIQPNYAIYRANLPAFINAAIKDEIG